MLPLPAGTDFGIYTLLDSLGHGGFAFAYLARDKQLGRRVCIKEHAPEGLCERDAESGEILPLPGMERAFAASLADFRREAEVLANLHHAQIPAVHEIFEAGGTAYAVTDYAEGLPLPQWLEEAPNGGASCRCCWKACCASCAAFTARACCTAISNPPT